MYQLNGQVLTQILQQVLSSNTDRFCQEYGDLVSLAERLLNSQHHVACHIRWSLGARDFSRQNESERIIFTVFHKNVFLFFSVMTLTKGGLYGPARTLARPIYEGLLLAKYCSVSGDYSSLGSYFNGSYINITNTVVNRIEVPSPNEFKTFWGALNKASHATIYSGQIEEDYEDIHFEMVKNCVLVLILLNCNYHLLTRHWLTPSTAYYTQRYNKKSDLQAARVDAREAIRLSCKFFDKPAKDLIRDYCRSWQLRGRNVHKKFNSSMQSDRAPLRGPGG